MSKRCDHDSRLAYETLIVPLRDTAAELGYALAVHGTLKRDIDLIAVPWTDAAVQPHDLAEALGRKAQEVNGVAFLLPHETGDYFLAGCPLSKPHGRLTWTFHLGGGPYIDLSVMPPMADPERHPALDEPGWIKRQPQIARRWREMWKQSDAPD